MSEFRKLCEALSAAEEVLNTLCGRSAFGDARARLVQAQGISAKVEGELGRSPATPKVWADFVVTCGCFQNDAHVASLARSLSLAFVFESWGRDLGTLEKKGPFRTARTRSRRCAGFAAKLEQFDVARAVPDDR